MKNLLRFLAFVLMVGGAHAQSNLPDCPVSLIIKYQNGDKGCLTDLPLSQFVEKRWKSKIFEVAKIYRFYMIAASSKCDVVSIGTTNSQWQANTRGQVSAIALSGCPSECSCSIVVDDGNVLVPQNQASLYGVNKSTNSDKLNLVGSAPLQQATVPKQELVASVSENATRKDTPIGQEDPFETVRKQAEKEFEETSLAQEARIRELERILAEPKAKEQIRVADEARIKEQQRIALEAQLKEQLRLAQETRQKEQERQLAEQNAKEQLLIAEETRIKEQRRMALEAQQKEQVRLAQEATGVKEQERLLAEQKAKEQIRLAEEARISDQQRLALESTEIKRLLAEAQESKRKQSDLEEQLKLAKQQNQVEPPSAMTAMANRKALVIGNDTYKSVSKLLNAREDAKAIAASLSTVGYQVTLKLDLNEKEMKAALRAFSSQVQGGDEVLFFFAGHGVQLGAANYLLPIDIGGESEAQVKDEAIQLQRILDDMSEKKSKFTLAMIDACRDNPFKTTGRAIGGRGMAPTTAATGQMVVFSAGTGQQALDRLGSNDKNKNGVFTRTFLKEMQKSGVSIDRIVKNVRNEVAGLAKSVGHEQVPAIYDQVLGDFYFKK